MRGAVHIFLGVLALVPPLYLALVPGCSPSTELGGIPILNSNPDTRITGTPPSLERTDIFVRFRWAGMDADGDIVGYQWKMSANGVDGISVSDTLTVDPATGDVLHPWRFTTAMDTTFVVTADSSGFAGDDDLPEEYRHFYQHHTFFVRAIDDAGAVDPTPAMVTFTAATLAPVIRLSTPRSLLGSYRDAMSLPPEFILGWSGNDPDYVGGAPSRVRYLLKEAVLHRDDGPDIPINSAYLFQTYKDRLISFAEPGWSDWIPYGEEEVDRRRAFSREPMPAGAEERYYFFALQARDTAGAVSLDLSYAKTVHNFRIDASKFPVLTVRGSFFETSSHTDIHAIVRMDVAQNQPVAFDWYASAEEYGGMITGYRYGWDVEDVSDDTDPGWQTRFGTAEVNTSAPLRTFESGLHTLTIEAIDNSEQVTRVRFVLTVVPVPEVRRPLLLVDDVVDKNSNGWPNYAGRPMDEDAIRDQFWGEVLSSVDGWVDDVDEYDTEETQQWGYREAVNYDVIIWTTKLAAPSYIQQKFDGYGGSFIWIESYVANIGNLFLAGAGAVTNFHPTANPGFSWAYPHLWLYPIIYDNSERLLYFGLTPMARSFGSRTVDGRERNNGLDEFGYRSLGLSAVSPLVPPNFFITDDAYGIGNFQITRRCAGTKALILDPEFSRSHGVMGAFPDTIFVWDAITPSDDYVVNLNYNFGQQDEFYDENITGRSTPWRHQLLADGSPAIVPMWRAYTRYDWILDHHLASGDTEFPGFLPLTQQTYCGTWGIDPLTARSQTDGVALGVLSYKNSAGRPERPADVVWGFDPTMIQHDGIAAAVRWVLGEHFGLALP